MALANLDARCGDCGACSECDTAPDRCGECHKPIASDDTLIRFAGLEEPFCEACAPDIEAQLNRAGVTAERVAS